MRLEIKIMDCKNKSHIEFQREMLYQAIYTPEGHTRPSKNILELPCIKKYIEGFGTKQDDLCYIACDIETNTNVGAIWIRKFSKDNPSYGFIDESTPEISIALAQSVRGKGVGTKLINHLIANMPKHIKKLSLSVDTDNRAYDLYKKIGFNNISVVNGTAIMLLNIENKLIC